MHTVEIGVSQDWSPARKRVLIHNDRDTVRCCGRAATLLAVKNTRYGKYDCVGNHSAVYFYRAPPPRRAET
jgi:hypothetical protein